MQFPTGSKWRVVSQPDAWQNEMGGWMKVGDIVTVTDVGEPGNVDEDGDVTVFHSSNLHDQVWISPKHIEPFGWVDQRGPEDMVE